MRKSRSRNIRSKKRRTRWVCCKKCGKKCPCLKLKKGLCKCCNKISRHYKKTRRRRRRRKSRKKTRRRRRRTRKRRGGGLIKWSKLNSFENHQYPEPSSNFSNQKGGGTNWLNWGLGDFEGGYYGAKNSLSNMYKGLTGRRSLESRDPTVPSEKQTSSQFAYKVPDVPNIYDEKATYVAGKHKLP